VLLRVPEKNKGFGQRKTLFSKPYFQKIIVKTLFAKKYPIKFYAPLDICLWIGYTIASSGGYCASAKTTF
jgi:hypothetical protein